MAKSKKPATRAKRAEKTKSAPLASEAVTKPVDPAKVHELFGVHGPYEPPNAPRDMPGYATFWDCVRRDS